MSRGRSVVVVGGGISGLVAATRVAAAGAQVTLLERSERLGGNVRTVSFAGRPLERRQALSSPDVLVEHQQRHLLAAFADRARLDRPRHAQRAGPVRGEGGKLVVGQGAGTRAAQ